MAFYSGETQPDNVAPEKHGIILCMLLAAGAVLASFLWQGHLGISIADEGYLWYGAQRVLLGEVPIRDFTSYDPGRYYWVAMIMTLLRNDGIIALRIANAIIQAMGLFLALVLLSRGSHKRSSFFLLTATVTMIFWMFPWFKLFDISLTIALIGILTFLAERPTRKRYFFSGLSIGFIAALCRQQGTFGVGGGLGVIAYLAINRPEGPGFIGGLFIWLAGIVTGYFPAFLMFILVPGYAVAFWNNMRAYPVGLNRLIGSIPVPWPWLAPFGQASFGAVVRWILSGLFFMAPIIFGAVGMVWAVYQNLRKRTVSPLLVACAFLALPLAWYVSIAPDISRLGLGIFSFLIWGLSFLYNRQTRAKWLLIGVLCGATILVMLPNHPGWSRNRYVEANLGGDRLKIYPETAKYFVMLNELVEDFAPNGRCFLVLPRLTTSYAVLRRKSPMLETYSFFPRSEVFQLAEIERIKSADPGFTIIYEESGIWLPFRETHPLIYRYILDHFEPLTGYSKDLPYQLFKSKQKAS